MRSIIQKLLDEAIEKMAKSRDPVHDEGHIERMLVDWDKLSKTIQSKVDCEVVALAICWHDIWRCQSDLPGALGLLFGYLVEGKKSAKIFEERARKLGLEKRIIRKTKEVIKNHPDLPWINRKTIEDKVMWDLDNLDGWSLERLNAWTKQLGKISRLGMKLVYFYFKIKMVNKKENSFYFKWSQDEFKKRKKVFFAKVEKYQQSLTSGL